MELIILIVAALGILIAFAYVVQFLTDIIKGWLPEVVLKKFTPLHIAGIIGIAIAILLRLDFFTMIGYPPQSVLMAQIFTGIMISAGSVGIHELIAKLRSSRSDKNY